MVSLVAWEDHGLIISRLWPMFDLEVKSLFDSIITV